MAHLVCNRCNSKYCLDEILWSCPCGGLLDIDFQPVAIERGVPQKHSLWHFRSAIPIRKDASIVSFDEGFTPLLQIDINNRSIYIKQDHLLPSGSFKDRGASVLISKVKELGITEIVMDSSGNAAASVACYGARAGIKCRIFVPESTSSAKLTQIKSYGAVLNKIPGTREDTAREVLKAARHTYYASHYWNPFFFQGTKTFAYEVCQQLGWQSPDVLVLPVGNGSLLLGAYIGFRELIKAKLIDRMPRFIAIQSQDCAPIYQAFQAGTELSPVTSRPGNLAEGIAIAHPIRGYQILSILRKNRGMVIAVNNGEIKSAWQEMVKKGFFIEPTSAAGIAGLKKYLTIAANRETIVSVFTGHGLKASHSLNKMIDHEKD